jgi:hypothetical protein
MGCPRSLQSGTRECLSRRYARIAFAVTASILRAALAQGDWLTVWSQITLSDTYFLGERYLARFPKDPWDSNATRALRENVSRNDGSRLHWFGASLTDSFLCAHPHLRIGAPYEDLEKDLLPFRLAERAAEFKLYLARQADLSGIPAAALGVLAEPSARAVLRGGQLTDIYDWRSMLAAYAKLNESTFAEALGK